MRGWLVMALLLGLGPAAAVAQDAPEPCTFDACALRVQHRFSGLRVVRGVQAETVARIGPFGGSVADAVARSDSALAHARASDRQRTMATVWGIVSVAASVVGWIGVSDGLWDDDPGAEAWVAVGVGAVSGIISGVYRTRSLDSLEQAVWWYNRDLALRGAR